ncbi:MAG TPA: family 43 glycosylhydrolase [Puia sp.]
MKNRKVIFMAAAACVLSAFHAPAWGQFSVAAPAGEDSKYENVETYVNPVLPGDHPDPTMIRVGNDFYHCGSSFHFTPYLPVYHSTDMVHWEVISRVVPPSRASFVSDRPSAGIWQGAITYFYGSYWIYFSSGGQWFCKASSPYGPWSEPVAVKTDAATGWLGYDNSIFVDDNGKPYMVIKNGQKVNRLRAIGRDGQLTDSVINLDWINAHLQYSWAEGPVMCKRNGYYFYFPAGDVSGGQYVLRTKELTSDSTKWERLGEFFRPVTDAKTGFRRPNHISAPIQLEDGTWWTIGQSYDKPPGDDWSGAGRQTSLFRVDWEGDRPWGEAPVSTPVERPRLSNTAGISWRSVRSDDFSADSLGLWWHFLNRKAAGKYSLGARKGWLRLMPGGDSTHVLQKQTDRYYTIVTRLQMDPADTADKAGIMLTNGNQRVTVRLYTGYGKKIVLQGNGEIRTVPNTMGRTVWLKLTRKEHMLTGYCSGDGVSWTSLGEPVSAASLDRAQPNFNSWVGTSMGLFAEGHAADFDRWVCKDGYTALEAVGYSNYYGVESSDKGVTNSSDKGGWLMISGVNLGVEGESAASVSVAASALRAGGLEVWMDDLKTGKKIASVPVTAGEGQTVIANLPKGISGSHDIFLKFPEGQSHGIFIKSIIFNKR